MNKKTKYILATLAAAAILFVSLLVAASLALKPNDYKPQIVELVKEKTQRNLTLAGDIRLAFFPRLGLDLGRASLSEFRSKKEFAAVEDMRLSLSWWPLLRKKVVVDQVRIEGVRANLVRFKNGTTNFDDLLKKEKDTPDTRIKFDIDSITVDKSALSFRDEMEGRRFALSDLSVTTGRLAMGRPAKAEADFFLKSDKPQINARFHLTTGLTFDTEAKQYAVKDLNLEVRGEAGGLSNLIAGFKGNMELDQTAGTMLAENMVATLTAKKGADDIDLTLTAPRWQWLAGNVASDKIELTAKVRQDSGDKGELGLTARIPSVSGDRQSFRVSGVTVEVTGKQPDGKYQGRLTSALSGNFSEKQFAFSGIKGSLTASSAKMAEKDLKLDLAGSAQLDLQEQVATLDLTSHLDGSTITLKAGITTPFAKPRIALDLGADRLDLDRYLPAREPEQRDRPEKPLDFSILKTLNAGGNVRVGSLTLYNIKAGNLRLAFKAADGRMVISPLSANLYQGTARGAVSLFAQGPRVAAHFDINGVSIGPLLKDSLHKDVLEGKGSLNFDLRAEGATVGDMKKSLQGKAGLDLRDGAVKGVNIPARLREARAVLGTLRGEKVQTVNTQEKTDFSELTAGFTIDRGVAHNRDLAAKSPLLRVSGDGDIDIGADMVDYRVRATVVGNLEGQGGKEPAALKGVTVPVRITGPMAAAKVTLDFNALVREGVQQEIKTRAIDTLEKGFKKLFR